MNFHDVLIEFRSEAIVRDPAQHSQLFARVLSELNLDYLHGMRISQGDSAELARVFVEAAKGLAARDSLVRKIAGWVLLAVANRARLDESVHLLAENSLLDNSVRHPDFATRGMSLRVVRQLRLANYRELKVKAGKRGLEDCEYVKRFAVMLADGEGDAEVLTKLAVEDSDPYVRTNALVVLRSFDRASLNGTRKFVDKEMVKRNLEKIDAASSSEKASILSVATSLDWTPDELIGLLDGAESLLASNIPSVLLHTMGILNSLETVESYRKVVNEMQNKVLQSLIKYAVDMPRTNPEVLHQVMDTLCGQVHRRYVFDLFTVNGIDWCLVHPKDPLYLILKKLDCLTNIAANFQTEKDTAICLEILTHVLMLSLTAKALVVEKCLNVVGKICNFAYQMIMNESDHKFHDILEACLNGYMQLLTQPSPSIVAVALRALIEGALVPYDGFVNEAFLKNYGKRFMELTPQCILLFKSSSRSVVETGLYSLLVYLNKCPWSEIDVDASYILEDIYDNYLSETNRKEFSTKFMLQFLFCMRECFNKSPNRTLPLVKEYLGRLGKSEDIFLKSFAIPQKFLFVKS